MKKLPFLFLTFLIIWQAETVNAQTLKSIKIRTGFSINLPGIRETSTVNGNFYEFSDFMSHQFLFGDLQAEWELPPKGLSLLTNISFISKGYSYNSGGSGFGSSFGGIYKQSAFANYGTINFLPKYSSQVEETKLVYAFAGPYIARLVSDDENYYYEFYTPDFRLQKIPMLKPWVIGGTFGGGITFKSKNNRINYDAQLQYMQDVSWAGKFKYSENHRKTHYTFEQKNKTFLIGFGIQYLLKDGK